jgi:hypothetical protein
VGCERRRLRRDPFHHAAVARLRVDVEIEQSEAVAVVAGELVLRVFRKQEIRPGNLYVHLSATSADAPLDLLRLLKVVRHAPNGVAIAHTLAADNEDVFLRNSDAIDDL